mmetsp:Transcript_18494/g.52300  ORF Transcript_18494/g.52300 Transcript_18494/m.52300 type:complete len:390 (-) Transcript_18494:689-1858(-)
MGGGEVRAVNQPLAMYQPRVRGAGGNHDGGFGHRGELRGGGAPHGHGRERVLRLEGEDAEDRRRVPLWRRRCRLLAGGAARGPGRGGLTLHAQEDREDLLDAGAELGPRARALLREGPAAVQEARLEGRRPAHGGGAEQELAQLPVRHPREGHMAAGDVEDEAAEREHVRRGRRGVAARQDLGRHPPQGAAHGVGASLDEAGEAKVEELRLHGVVGRLLDEDVGVLDVAVHDDWLSRVEVAQRRSNVHQDSDAQRDKAGVRKLLPLHDARHEHLEGFPLDQLKDKAHLDALDSRSQHRPVQRNDVGVPQASQYPQFVAGCFKEDFLRSALQDCLGRLECDIGSMVPAPHHDAEAPFAQWSCVTCARQLHLLLIDEPLLPQSQLDERFEG